MTSRWLDEQEFLRLYRWLECPDTPVHLPYTRAARYSRPEVAAELIESTKPSAMAGFSRPPPTQAV